MSKVLTYLNNVLLGSKSYFQTDKMIVVLLAVLLVMWLKEKSKSQVDRKGNRLLVYTFFMTVVLLCPVTAVVVMVYQTAFYDYEWAWSMVPVVAVIAYVMVLLYDEWMETLPGWKKTVAVGLVLLMLFVCGNQGTLQTVTEAESNACKQTTALIECIEQNSDATEVVLWAPKELMQEVRRQTGEILLVYGRDMWDEKSGAYDYEIYEEGLIQAYEWMEWQDEFSKTVADQETFDVLCEEYELDEEVQMHIQTMILSGVNTLVLPKMSNEHFESAVIHMMEYNSMTYEKVTIEQYVVYMLK